MLSSLSSVESYFEFFSIRSDQECQVRDTTRVSGRHVFNILFWHLNNYNTKELEEAEIELELIKNEKAVQKFVGRPQDTVAPGVLSCKISDY